MSKVWLVTGSASGLERIITEKALQAGHKMVATAREIDKLDDLKDKYGEALRTAQVDVTDEAQGRAAVEEAVSAFGSLDVLVNNAGYGDLRPFEEVSSEDFRALVETCFFGVVNLT